MAGPSRRPLPHELALGGFGTAAGAATLLMGAPGVGLAILAGVGAFALAARTGPLKVRLALSYFLALGLYQSIRFVVPALHRAPMDPALAALDLMLFGSAPGTWIAPRPELTELLSAAYLSYQLYLHGALAHALFRPADEAQHLYQSVFTAMGLGFLGYVLVPALGPPHAALPGGPLTAINAWVVDHGSSGFDAFPSLHVAVTALLLAHDARFARRRFAVMLPIALLLAISTLYLQYHHAVDLLAGAVLALGVFLAQLPRNRPA